MTTRSLLDIEECIQKTLDYYGPLAAPDLRDKLVELGVSISLMELTLDLRPMVTKNEVFQRTTPTGTTLYYRLHMARAGRLAAMTQEK